MKFRFLTQDRRLNLFGPSRLILLTAALATVAAAAPPRAEQAGSTSLAQRYRALALELLAECPRLLENPREILPNWQHPRQFDPNIDTKEPPRDQVLADLAGAYARLGELEQARQLAAGLRMAEARVRAHTAIAEAALEAGDQEGARAAFKKAFGGLGVVSASQSVTLRLELVRLAKELNDVPALERLRAGIYPGAGPRIARKGAASLIPREKYQAAADNAAALAARGQTEEALKIAEGIPLAMHRARAYLDIAIARSERDDEPGARRAAARASAVARKTLGPAHRADLFTLLGGVYGRVGYRKHAEWAFGRAHEAIPFVPESNSISTETGYMRMLIDRPQAYLLLAHTQARVGDLDGAFRTMARVTAPDPHSLRFRVYRLQTDGWLSLARTARARGDQTKTRMALAGALKAVRAAGDAEAPNALEVATLAEACGLGALSGEAERLFAAGVAARRRADFGFVHELVEKRTELAQAIAGAVRTPPAPPEVPAAASDEPAPPPADVPTPPSSTLAGGRTITWACAAQPQVSYQLYMPKNRTLATVRDVFLLIPPGGSARLPSPQLADQLGWAFVGLQKTTYDLGELMGAVLAAVRDLSQRAGHPLRWRFGGLSAGGYASMHTARVLPEVCAGVVMVGSFDEVDDVTFPVVFLVGENDYARGDAERIYERLRAGKRWCRLMLHPGGHTYGRPADLENAIRHLARNSPR